jgi:hypothetical protein
LRHQEAFWSIWRAAVTIYHWNEKNELTKVNYYQTFGSTSDNDYEIDYAYDDEKPK